MVLPNPASTARGISCILYLVSVYNFEVDVLFLERSSAKVRLVLQHRQGSKSTETQEPEQSAHGKGE